MKIKFYQDGKWSGGGVLPGQLRDLSNLAGWIRDFLAEVSDIRKTYISAVSDDGRLLGQEKADLVLEIDQVISGILLFRQYVSENRSDSFSSGTDGFSYSVTIHEKTWLGEGRLSFSDEIRRMNFADLHNDLIMERVRAIFILYGESCRDRVITLTERQRMFELIDRVLCDFMRVERSLLFNDISN